MKQLQYYVYILGNSKPILYIGVTNSLQRRFWEHLNNYQELGFVKRYNCSKLLYFECFDDVNRAIAREKQLKRWHREWKLNLIKKMNPNFDDLSKEFDW